MSTRGCQAAGGLKADPHALLQPARCERASLALMQIPFAAW
jgi:hypothetical protein